MNLPFSEQRDGLPIWRLQVDDPAAAAEAKAELVHRAFEFPQGGVLALCLKLYDRPGRPALFHHAVAFSSLEFFALQRYPQILLVFEKKGWISDAQKALPLNLDLPTYGEGEAALAPYLTAYRRLQPLRGSPEAAWDAIEGELRAPVQATRARPAWVKVLLALAAAAAAVGAFYFLR